MLHEFGHFIMAKRAGIGVEEFGFGLPPRLWGKKIKGTIYSLNWLPFGGFVKLVGEDPTDKRKDQQNSFYTKSWGQRASVVLAGIFMNFLLAVLIFYVILAALGFKISLPLLVENNFKFADQTKQVLIADVSENSAASGAGIAAGDSILAANGSTVGSIEDLQKIIRANEGKTVEFVLENPINNKTRTVSVTPSYNEALKAPAIGVGLGELVVLHYDTFSQKLFSGFGHAYNTTVYSFKVFGQLIGYSISHRDLAPVSEGVSGPVGIAQITSQAVALGPLSVLQLAGLLSLNLAIMNLLPIPALDGGRFFFLLVEVITRRRVHANFEKWAHTIGFAVLLGLIVLVTFNDIAKLIR